jgi:hypothetical protein
MTFDITVYATLTKNKNRTNFTINGTSNQPKWKWEDKWGVE